MSLDSQAAPPSRGSSSLKSSLGGICCRCQQLAPPPRLRPIAAATAPPQSTLESPPNAQDPFPVLPSSHPEPAPSQREGRVRLLTTITRRRTPAVTTSANSLMGPPASSLSQRVFRRCFRVGQAIEAQDRARAASSYLALEEARRTISAPAVFSVTGAPFPDRTRSSFAANRIRRCSGSQTLEAP
jgi:hypothetical protein